jgi:Transposase DDE domain group 1
MRRTAKSPSTRRAGGQPARPGGEFFARPAGPNHRRYEALRGYLYEGLSAPDAAARGRYSVATLRSLVRDFRAGKTGFFLTPRPGPTRAPAKHAARARIIELRRAGHSATEISEILAGTPTPLNRTGVAEVLAEAGFPRLPVRPPGQRGAPYRDHPPRAQVIDLAALPARAETKLAGLLLAVPELVALDLPGLVATAGYPGTSVIPPVSYLLSLLALKLTGIRRVSHVDDLAADPGAALFAGLAALPKATALTTYSYRLDHTRQQALLTALGRAMLAANLIADAGGDLDLDFHAIMHWGEDVALERNYVPRRSQRTQSVLTFFAQDASTDTLVYANADLTKATQANEALVFAEHWKALTGNWPAMLVMDQKVTTQAVLAKLDERSIGFLTLRMRSPALTRHIQQLPAAAWRTVRLDRDGAYRRPKVVDEQATLSAYPRPVRQLIVNGLGHDAPTVIITNKQAATAKALIEHYARRMGIEQRLAEAIRSFHLDALAGAVPLNIDLDVVLTVLAGAVCTSLRRRLTGYHTATPDTLQRRFLSTGGVIVNHGSQITVRLSRRTYSPVLRQAAIPDVAVPWWGGRTLRFEYQ